MMLTKSLQQSFWADILHQEKAPCYEWSSNDRRLEWCNKSQQVFARRILPEDQEGGGISVFQRAGDTSLFSGGKSLRGFDQCVAKKGVVSIIGGHIERYAVSL